MKAKPYKVYGMRQKKYLEGRSWQDRPLKCKKKNAREISAKHLIYHLKG